VETVPIKVLLLVLQVVKEMGVTGFMIISEFMPAGGLQPNQIPVMHGFGFCITRMVKSTEAIVIKSMDYMYVV
jgi:hypothetical protein